MKVPAIFALLFSTLFISLDSQAVVILEVKNKTIEGALLEILHNSETNSGTIIARPSECNNCKPLSLTYKGLFSFSINGNKTTYTGNSPKLGQGDISYDPDNFTVDHVNLYEE
jgi:hypothetical protein